MKDTNWVELNELVFSRKNPKFIYRDKNARKIFKEIKKGSLVYWKRDGLIWSGEVARVSGGLEVIII